MLDILKHRTYRHLFFAQVVALLGTAMPIKMTAYVLIAPLASAFTPTFQSTIPDTLPDEDDYTRALSLSRLAYDMENLLSPALAAVILLTTS